MSEHRVLASAAAVDRTAERGDAVYQATREGGVADSLRTAAAQLEHDAPTFAEDRS